MNQLKIIDLEFIKDLSERENNNLTGGLDADLDADLDAELEAELILGKPTIIFGRASSASAGAIAASLRGTAFANAIADA
ncbi:MAG: hypothetical protein AAF383_07805 [Cyanobacteria bacterium P01_A01_bin.83]